MFAQHDNNADSSFSIENSEEKTEKFDNIVKQNLFPPFSSPLTYYISEEKSFEDFRKKIKKLFIAIYDY